MYKTPMIGLAALLGTAPAWADDMRCQSELVQTGDSIESLLQKCGDPDSKNESRWIYETDGRSYQVSVSEDNSIAEITLLLND